MRGWCRRGSACTEWGKGYAEEEGDLADLAVVVEEFLLLDEFEVELELVLDEGGDEDEFVLVVGVCEEGGDGDVEEVVLLGDIGEFCGERFDLALEAVAVVDLQELPQQVVEVQILRLPLH